MLLSTCMSIITPHAQRERGKVNGINDNYNSMMNGGVVLPIKLDNLLNLLGTTRASINMIL